MSNSTNQLNQRISYLYSKLNSGTPVPTSSTLSQVLANGNSAGGQNITNVNNLGVTTINGSAYPPVVTTPTLAQVLTAGNTATNSIILNNGATNVITTDPSLNTIVVTDGTTTNTINKNGYTTRNTTANLTHYLNFSDASTTGTGAIQKTAGISCNPSTNIIIATTFSGDLSGNALTATTATNATNVGITTDNTSGTYYIPFAKTSGTGNKPLFIDDTTTPLTYNPSTGVFTAPSFSGSVSTATTATNVTTTSDNTSGTYYIPFSKTTAGTSTALYLDDTTTPLTYNPSTSVVTATTFSGNATTATTATTATNVTTTSDNTSGTYYLPFIKTTAGASTPLYVDDTTGPLSYNPSTSTLSATIFSTATAPVSGSQLGNKTYIDNYGGGAGWYYTTSVPEMVHKRGTCNGYLRGVAAAPTPFLSALQGQALFRRDDGCK